MWPSMKCIATSLIWGVGLVSSAINLDGTQALLPVAEDDPSPIGDPSTYHPDRHDCPLPCVDYTNIHSWITYLSIERLRRCKKPMLLQLSITQPLDDPESVVLIRSCTLEPGSDTITTNLPSVENPKKDGTLSRPSLENEPACLAAGIETPAEMNLLMSADGGKADGKDIARLIQGMQDFFTAQANCDENFVFAYHKEIVASVYIGAELGKRTAQSVLEILAGRLETYGPVPSQAISQLCHAERTPGRMLGVSIDTTGNLASVQKMAYEWSMGICAVGGHLQSIGGLPGVKTWEIFDNSTLAKNETYFFMPSLNRGTRRPSLLSKRDTCRHTKVVPGDGCAVLASRCGISNDDFYKYNSKPNLCANLMPGDYICCSPGDPYTEPKPEAPKPSPDGTCATHIIKNGDTCYNLAQTYGVTTEQIEEWNKGKTWAWSECKDMLIGYSMCVSDGSAALPPPQEGTECGPLVPGTKEKYEKTRRITGKLVSLADFNPCPLKACCSNWGYCGIFPAHCEVHTLEGGGPGSKKRDQANTCISNCGMETKQNSGPPATFQRIGYYESWNLQRDCLWLKAENANTDGSYTHIHWSFAEIDPSNWKPIIKDQSGQWNDFKALPNVKRILSFGGWAYSTEPATYNIIRQAIIRNRNTFATHLAQFAQDEGIDGIDIDWEYPGAPDILVNGQPIGRKNDGIEYLKFLMAFPIDRIARVVDYIVYMTYDLHGQWDYGKVNSFEACPSGKCIRSHVNLTETRNALAIITKAGIPNNKIFVGESSYGRSFHMAEEGCWGPMCEFTGSNTKSDATPGRCTKTGGYISNAEITEMIRNGHGVRHFYDRNSNSDVVISNGDYISYMTPTTKEKRRADWTNLNFAGTIDWALDLQAFSSDDFDAPPDRPKSGDACIQGRDLKIDSGDLCQFSCEYGFCPESICQCLERGPMKDLPPEHPGDKMVAEDAFDVDLNRLCKFACKYGHCPDDICVPDRDESDDSTEENNPLQIGNIPNYVDVYAIRGQNSWQCWIFRDTRKREVGLAPCRTLCQDTLDEAEKEGRTTNYGCVGHFPLDQEMPWSPYPLTEESSVVGKCQCDNWLVNELATTVVEALPVIAQIGCYVLMSSFKFVLDLATNFIPFVRAGKVIVDVGLKMLTAAAQLLSYAYPEDQDPEGAFSWWLQPCGNTDLVPEDIKKAFDLLNQVPTSRSGFKSPRRIRKGSGRKGDSGNPRTRARPQPSRPAGPGGRTRRCSIPAHRATKRVGMGRNTLRMLSCDSNDRTKTQEMIVTSAIYAPNAKPTLVTGTCSKKWSQACYHYSSANRENKQWQTLTCPPEAATTGNRLNARATAIWESEHTGTGWMGSVNGVNQKCHMDEWPPAYLLGPGDPARLNAGLNKLGQRVRYLPARENTGAASLWRSVCLGPALDSLTDAEFKRRVERDPRSHKASNAKGHQQIRAKITVGARPEFTFSSWEHSSNPARDDGLWENPCWPKNLATRDPGFALLSLDEWYDRNPRVPGGRTQWDYSKPYVKGQNGD